ncbi:microtubule-associated serine/threonine-protein kinase 3-like isoform 2-T2 [Anomaloglossus baeobatrachus]|uniref:microtubule-associated serine/threonine-protein kinase 3-like isoform X2 n=1 Tax=Anomaloglossus baeobatrachus TaxID=238106 RepID=UPI003F5072C9
MSGILPEKLQVLALLWGILITYAPDIVLPLADGVLSFTYRLVMELVRDCLTKYQQGRISSEYLEHLQQNIRTLVQKAEEKSHSGELAFFKQLAQNVLMVLEYPFCSLERQETSEGDSEERQNLNVPDPDSSQQELNHDLIEITLPANTDGGLCERPEIINESASALIGSYNPRRNPCKSDYKPIQLIGHGAFGDIHLVRHKDTNQIYAMKKIQKQKLKEPRRLEQVFVERDISTFADCPFVVSMFCSFPSKLHLNMVMEYTPGGDCKRLLKSKGPLPVTLARMYIAETVLAVEYLHNYGVLHRDLKPENLLITSTGHIKVTDFGLSKLGLMRPTSDIYKATAEDIINEFHDKEIVGTPQYIAPEVILRKDYGRPIDWWSIGIILYQFLFRFPPFVGDNTIQILGSVVNDDIALRFQNISAPPEAQGFITELLNKNPSKRLGTGGANEIKIHPFMCDLDFDNLLSQKPLFIPDLKSDEDTWYFNKNVNFMKYKYIDSDEGDTMEDNDLPEVQNFVSSSQRYSKLYITNTEKMNNEESMSPPGCSSKNSVKHSNMEIKPFCAKPVGDNQCLTAKNIKSSSPLLSDSPGQKRTKSALKLRKEQKSEKVDEGGSKRVRIHVEQM